MTSHLFAFDLSMDCTGYTIFDLISLKPIHIGSIETNKKHTHGKRLYQIGTELIKLKDTYNPDVVVIERGFSRFNTSTQVIYRVHGLTNFIFHDIEQVYYPIKTVKECIYRGDATKEIIRKMIESAYPDVTFANEDESDSFSVGLAYFIKNNKLNWDKSIVKVASTKKKKKTS